MTRQQITELADNKISQLLDKHGAFFAFNNDQFNDNRVDGVEYVGFIGGGVVPKHNYKALMAGLDQVIKWKNDQIKQLDSAKVIEYELSNYEAYYTGDISDAYEVLKAYGYTRDQVYQVYRDTMYKYEY